MYILALILFISGSWSSVSYSSTPIKIGMTWTMLPQPPSGISKIFTEGLDLININDYFRKIDKASDPKETRRLFDEAAQKMYDLSKGAEQVSELIDTGKKFTASLMGQKCAPGQKLKTLSKDEIKEKLRLINFARKSVQSTLGSLLQSNKSKQNISGSVWNNIKNVELSLFPSGKRLSNELKNGDIDLAVSDGPTAALNNFDKHFSPLAMAARHPEEFKGIRPLLVLRKDDPALQKLIRYKDFDSIKSDYRYSLTPDELKKLKTRLSQAYKDNVHIAGVAPIGPEASYLGDAQDKIELKSRYEKYSRQWGAASNTKQKDQIYKQYLKEHTEIAGRTAHGAFIENTQVLQLTEKGMTQLFSDLSKRPLALWQDRNQYNSLVFLEHSLKKANIDPNQYFTAFDNDAPTNKSDSPASMLYREKIKDSHLPPIALQSRRDFAFDAYNSPSLTYRNLIAVEKKDHSIPPAAIWYEPKNFKNKFGENHVNTLKHALEGTVRDFQQGGGNSAYGSDQLSAVTREMLNLSTLFWTVKYFERPNATFLDSLGRFRDGSVSTEPELTLRHGDDCHTLSPGLTLINTMIRNRQTGVTSESTHVPGFNHGK